MTTSRLIHALLLAGITWSFIGSSSSAEDDTLADATEKLTSTRIDERLESLHKQHGIESAKRCSDSQFVRRLTLDLRGRIPTVEELIRFQQNPDRARLVEELLNADSFPRFLSEAWTTWFLGYSNEFGTDREIFRKWLEGEIRRGTSFRQIAYQMISAEGYISATPPVNYVARHFDQPMIHVCRTFLGVRLECAQCHDHPFDRWSQDDYEQMNRFFQVTRRREINGTLVLRDESAQADDIRERPKFLTGSRPSTARYRAELALFVTSCKPFARTFVNRVWYQLLGAGLINPPDDHNTENPAVDRQLLEQLASFCVDHDFQIKPLVRLICNTQAYQRASHKSTPDQRDYELFAVRKIKPLLPEQFVDSVTVALDQPVDPVERREMIRQLTESGNDLVEDYQRTWDYRETVQQLMKKVTIRIKKRPDDNLDQVYLRVLSRNPTKRERELCRSYSMQDVTFALVFGNEFFFNH